MVTNLINNKIYIGKTTTSLKMRFKGHCSPKNKKRSLLTKAILKYGKNNFKIEQIDTADNISDLSKKEKFWINKMNSKSPIGYNILSGDINEIKEYSSKMSIPIINLDTNELFPSINRAAIKYDIHANQLLKVIRGIDKSAKGFRFAYVDQEKRAKAESVRSKLEQKGIENLLKMQHSNKISIININNGKIYQSILDAAKDCGFKSTDITKVCKGKRDNIFGVKFEYLDSDKNEEGKRTRDLIKNNRKTYPKEVICMNTGEKFKTIKEASIKLKISASNIRDVCVGKTDQINGFIFEFINEDLKTKGEKTRNERKLKAMKREDSIKLAQNKNKKKIICLNNGKIYESATEAGRLLGISNSGISTCARGELQHIKQYRFKYI